MKTINTVYRFSRRFHRLPASILADLAAKTALAVLLYALSFVLTVAILAECGAL